MPADSYHVSRPATHTRGDSSHRYPAARIPSDSFLIFTALVSEQHRPSHKKPETGLRLTVLLRARAKAHFLHEGLFLFLVPPDDVFPTAVCTRINSTILDNRVKRYEREAP